MAKISKETLKSIAASADSFMEQYDSMSGAGENESRHSPKKMLPEEPSRKHLMEVPKIASNPSLTPELAHEKWVENRVSLGWQPRNYVDPDKKYHPLVVPYDKLPKKYRVRDALYFSFVRRALALVSPLEEKLEEASAQTPAPAPTPAHPSHKDELANVRRAVRYR